MYVSLEDLSAGLDVLYLHSAFVFIQIFTLKPHVYTTRLLPIKFQSHIGRKSRALSASHEHSFHAGVFSAIQRSEDGVPSWTISCRREFYRL